ncbi:MAG: biofilm PGA synthesis N-glycosyltransferase PgaC [Kangiellaceae bacterium]|jgi:biofilm PGA synthesis N-glycosyltransferase PgaC
MKTSVSISGLLFLCLLYFVSASVFYLAMTTEYIPSDSLTNTRLVIFLILAPIIVKYIIQLFAIPFYTLVEKYQQSRCLLPTDYSVSVLIPAWNEEMGILKTLKSVLQTHYANLEVIVINDGSTDSTHQLVSDYINTYHADADSAAMAKVKYFDLPNGGKAKALNYGLKNSTGEIIITIDADSVMEAKAITNIIKRFTDKEVAAVAGNVIVGNRRTPIELMQQLEYLYGFFFKRADSIFNSVYIIGGAAAAYRKKVLDELGGFDEHIITEDIEMSTRILGAGYKTRYAADAVVYTEGPSNFKDLFNQRLRWKFGRLLTFIKHRHLFFSCSKKHSPYLTFMLLPLAVYAELTLLFEALLLAVFYGYTFYTQDYIPLVFVIGFISTVIIIQIVVDSKTRFHSNLLILAPVAWIIFYIIDAVEFQALVRSLIRLKNKENVQWQKWVRVGLKTHLK